MNPGKSLFLSWLTLMASFPDGYSKPKSNAWLSSRSLLAQHANPSGDNFEVIWPDACSNFASKADRLPFWGRVFSNPRMSLKRKERQEGRWDSFLKVCESKSSGSQEVVLVLV